MPSIPASKRLGRRIPSRLVLRSTGPTEHQHQVSLFKWAGWMTRQYQELRWMYAVPNGAFLGRDRKAAVIHARRMLAEGLKPGMLDVVLPAARGGYHGLYIEMKAGNNDTSDEQDAWAEGLSALGHLVVICWNSDTARTVIVDYLEGKLVKP